MKKRVIIFGVLILALVGLVAAAGAAGRSPLLQPGKKTLFQRAVSHPGAVLRSQPEAAAPGAVLRSQPEAAAPAVNAAVTPFTVFYIYGRQKGWVEVGVGGDGPQGWLTESSLTDWPQALTLLFTERTGRRPVLFFKEERGLRDLAEARDIPGRLDQLEAGVFGTGRAPADFPVVAAEPDDRQGAVSRRRFYLMPILAMTDPYQGVKFLKVASIDPADDGRKKPEAAPPEEPGGNMRTAIALVIDTTISMKPYIDQSLGLIRGAFDALEKDGLTEGVAFGVVAFRSDPEVSPGLEYRTRVVSDFRTVTDRRELEKALAKVNEAKVSSHAFEEDSLAGVKEAVDRLSWDDYQSRLLILISDAGPLAGSDQHAGVKMDSPEMRDYARAKNIWITVAYIQSPSGAKNRASAEKAYRQLAQLDGLDSGYIAIPAPNPVEGAASFARATQALTRSLTDITKATREGREVKKPDERSAGAQNPEEEARRLGRNIGYAMRLEFLGRERANPAPEVALAWIADQDLARLAENRSSPAVEVAVLLTKNQLSDLREQLRIIIDEAEKAKKTDARGFFQSILSASAQLTRDPARFSRQPGRNLMETGVLAEFLADMPYKSDVMLLEEADWYRMSIGEQTAFINRLRSRIARYEEYDRDRDNWESFGSPNPGDWVYRVPLSMLP